MISSRQKNNFVYNSNMIEGINYPLKLYSNLKEKIKYPEIFDHKEALEYVINNFKENLTETKILKIHKILTKNILNSDNSGKYRKCNIKIGGEYGCPPVGIKIKMQDLVKMIKKVKVYQDCWDVHNEFEVIHPFVDGNGRTGRLILNWLLLKNNFKFEVIKYENKLNYYNEIKKYRFYRFISSLEKYGDMN